MKKMRKIIGVLLLIALVLSSIAVISLAAPASYKGKIQTVKEMMALVVTGKYVSSPSVTFVRGTNDQTRLLAQIYSYLEDTPVDPADPEYPGFEETYNKATFRVAYVLYENYKEAAEGEAKEDALITLLVHTKTAAILNRESNANLRIVIGHKCPDCNKEIMLTRRGDLVISDTRTGTESVDPATRANNIFVYDSVNASVTRPDGCTHTSALVPTTLKYSDFEVDLNEVNDKAYTVLDKMISDLFDNSNSGDVDYYEYISTLETAKNILASLNNLSYSETYDKTVYTGKLETFTLKVDALSASQSLETLKAGLADVYNYLKDTPVNPTSDGYYGAYAKYLELATALSAKYRDAVEKAPADTDAVYEGSRLAILTEWRAYLAATPLCDASVNSFNQKRGEIIAEYADCETELSAFSAIAPLPPVIDADAEVFRGKLEALETADTLEARKNAFAELYTFVTANDISLSETDLIARYVSERDALRDELIATVNNESSLDDKITALEELRSYLAVTPISKATVDRYNSLRRTIIASCENVISGMEGRGFIPSYSDPKTYAVTAKESTVKGFLAILEDSISEYNAAEPEDKADALERAKSAAKDIYVYLKAATPDVSAEYYEEFILRYNAAREELVLAMISTAEAAATEEAFRSVRDYLNAYPLSKDLVDSYNQKVDTVFATDEALKNSLKASCVYHKIDEVVGRINDYEDIDSLYSDMKTLSGYYNSKFDITDSAYSDFRNTVYPSAENAFINAVKIQVNAKFSPEDMLVELTRLSSFTKDVYFNSSSVQKMVDEIFSAKISEFDTYISELNSAAAAEIVSDYDEILELIYEFNNTDNSDYEARKAAFVALYNRVVASEDTAITNTDSDYAALMEIYVAACLEMEADLVAYVDSFITFADKLNALRDVSAYLESYKFSNSAVETYNAKLAAMDVGYGEEKTKVEALETLVYAPVASTSSDFASLNTILAGSVDKDELSDAYHIIANAKFDFGASQYAAVLAAFNSAKTDVMATFEAELNAAPNKADKVREIEAYFVKDMSDVNDKSNIFSASMINSYNSMINKSLRAETTAEVVAQHKFLKPLVEKIDKYIDCIDDSALTSDEKIRYDAIKNFYRTAARYAYIGGEIIYVDAIHVERTIDGKTADVSLVYKKQALSELTYYMSKNVEGNSIFRSFTERAFVNAVYKNAFIKILHEIDKLSPAGKEAEIATWTEYAALNCLPSELVDLFNARFGTEIPVTRPARASSEGTVLEFFAELEGFKSANDLSAMKAEFAELTVYLNVNPIPQNKTYEIYYPVSESGEEIQNDPLSPLKLSIHNQIEAQKEALESQVPTTQYALGYEKDSNGTLAAVNQINGTFRYDGGSAYTYRMAGVSGSPQIIEGNGYVTQYAGHGSEYFDLWATNEDSIVFEFDIMIPENNGGKQAIMFSSSSIYFWIEDYTLKYNTDFSSARYFDLPTGEDIIKFTPGEWRHITFIVNIEDGIRELHVDYVPIAKSSVVLQYNSDVWSAYGRETHFVRFQNMIQYPTAIYDNIYCYDNICVYDGKMYRNPDRFSSMQEVAQFQQHVNDFMNTDATAQDRLYSYYQARSLYETVKDNPTITKHVVMYESFDYVNEIETPAREYYMNVIREDMAEIESVTITTSTVTSQEAKITALQNYISNNILFLDATNPELLEINNKLTEYQHQVNLTGYIDDLALSISQFFRAPTLTSLNKHYANLEKYIELSELREEGNEDRIMKDPLIKSTFIPIKINRQVKELFAGRALTITSFCEIYVPWRLAEQTRIENTDKILDCMSFIETIVDDGTLSGAAYETALVNKAVEDANYDFVESYMAVIRRIRTSGEYIADAEGIARALYLADLIDAKFYVNLQTKHLAVLKEYTEKYSLTNSYIERLGICMYLENYIADNDIDFTNPAAVTYRETLIAYQNEVQQYLVDYEKLLQSNTVAFVGIVKEMGTYVDYADIKPLYDKALTTYYYAMNTDSPEAKAAATRFNEYGEWLTALEENSAMFVGYSKNLTSKRQAQKYRALVNCAKCIEEGVDEGIDGVKKAMETYNEALAEYNASIGAVNGELSEVTDVVSAVRSNSVASTVLAIIKRIFN